jgi:hypothetical protein
MAVFAPRFLSGAAQWKQTVRIKESSGRQSVRRQASMSHRISMSVSLVLPEKPPKPAIVHSSPTWPIGPAKVMLHGRGLVDDDKLLDADRFAEVDGTNAVGFDLIETKCVHDRRAGFAPHQIDRGATGRISIIEILYGQLKVIGAPNSILPKFGNIWRPKRSE